jgi:transketolase
MPAVDIDQLSIDTIRTLSMDAVQKARSGHPGTPMALAPVAYALWQRVLRYDPEDPIWPDRDRFVLSNGHASMLLYSLLYLAGVKAVNPDYERLGEPAVSLSDIERFRQLDSRTPGHPEYRWTSGVEATTGPLGQGIANSVGMALGARWLAARYNRPGFDLFTHRVFAFCGDGDLMEGLGSEAASLAGHLGLENLCWIYDNNRVTLSGPASLAFSEDVACRFLAYGWNVLRVGDANDCELVEQALRTFERTPGRPTLIIIDSHIGYGAPNKQDTYQAHGEPLGEDEVRLAKRFYGWPEDATFLVPNGVRERFREVLGRRGQELRTAWMAKLEAYRARFPTLAVELDQIQRRQLPDGWDKDLPAFPADPKGLATRESSAKALNAIARNVPWLLSGDADLAPSTKTRLTFEGAGDLEAGSPGGRNLHFGVREHGMAATLNGLALEKLRAIGSTFLTFSDYARPAIRLSALMELPVIYVFTHDSIGLGEDGPTHQPVEHLASLRAIPGLIVLRPADANEVVEAWKVIMRQRHRPAALVLTRQAVPTLDRRRYAPASGVERGAYVLADPPAGRAQVLLLATGSEVALALAAHEQLAAEGVRSRVVSMPSWELFEAQDEQYRASVLLPEVTARVAVEQASTFGWERYVGTKGRVIGMKTFGASAPLKELQRKFGFTPDAVVAAAREQLGQGGKQ